MQNERTFIFTGPNGQKEVIKAVSEAKAREKLALIYGTSEGWAIHSSQG